MRSQKEYERVFEDMMSYTNFKTVDDILGNDYSATNENLRDFIGEFHDDITQTSGKRVRPTRKFAFEFGKAFWRLAKGQSKSKTYHEVGGGHDISRDRKQTSERVVKTKDEYLLRGASKVDLKGYDTKQKKKSKRKPKVHFNKLGSSKGKKIYGRAIKVKLRGKVFTRYIDSKGRFIKAR